MIVGQEQAIQTKQDLPKKKILPASRYKRNKTILA